MNKLYLISQTVNNDYDTYDSAVVCAINPEAARAIHPRGDGKVTQPVMEDYDSWCGLGDVQVNEIGIAADHIAPGVVCASFNAG